MCFWFGTEEDVGNYSQTQEELLDTLKVAEIFEVRDRVYEPMITRLPGLASTTQPLQDYAYV